MKIRLDNLLISRQLFSSRSSAENYINLGKILISRDGKIWKIARKSGEFVDENIFIKLEISEQFVSRAALKLQSVAQILNVDFRDKTVLDIGSSTGGFTEFALKNGAKKVFAVDVGTNQLSRKLRENPEIFSKIELHEKTDIRDFLPREKSTQIDIVLADVSFISLDEILPKTLKNLRANFAENCEFILMVKPQFQLKKSNQNQRKFLRGGVVKNETARREIFAKFELFAKKYFVILAKKDSEISGTKGNRERFYLLKIIKRDYNLS